MIQARTEKRVVEQLEAEVASLKASIVAQKNSAKIDVTKAAKDIARMILADSGTSPVAYWDNDLTEGSASKDRQAIINRHVEAWRQANLRKAQQLSK